MRAVLQLCKSAKLCIDRDTHAEIGYGLLLLVGISAKDTQTEATLLADKIAKLRIFPDETGRLNKNLCDPFVGGEIMVVSNFTLYADCKKSRRPDFFSAANGNAASVLFDGFVAALRLKTENLCVENGWKSPKITTGVFGADMQISLVNDGPVTLILDTDTL